MFEVLIATRLWSLGQTIQWSLTFVWQFNQAECSTLFATYSYAAHTRVPVDTPGHLLSVSNRYGTVLADNTYFTQPTNDLVD